MFVVLSEIFVMCVCDGVGLLLLNMLVCVVFSCVWLVM